MMIAQFRDVAVGKYTELVTTAMSAVSTVTTVASWALVLIGLFVAIVAFFGWKACIGAVEKKAEKKLDAYIGSPEFKQKTEQKIEAFVREVTQARIAVIVTPQSDGRGNGSSSEEFPEPPRGGQ